MQHWKSYLNDNQNIILHEKWRLMNFYDAHLKEN